MYVKRHYLLALIAIVLYCTIWAKIEFHVHHGPIDTETRQALAALDHPHFSNYPYLLATTLEQALENWKQLSTAKTILVVARDNNSLIGCLYQ